MIRREIAILVILFIGSCNFDFSSFNHSKKTSPLKNEPTLPIPEKQSPDPDPVIEVINDLPDIPEQTQICPAESSTTPNHVYVDPVKGNDACSGKSADTAFRTLERARDEVRKTNKNMTTHLVIDLLPGTYFLDKTFELSSDDSGTNGYSVIYQGADKASVTISGGQLLSRNNWSLHNSSLNIYKTSVNSNGFRQLYVNNQRATRARSVLNAIKSVKNATGYALEAFSLESWKNLSSVEILSLSQWKAFRCGILQASGSTIAIKEPCWTRALTLSGMAINEVSWIENAFELLNEKGEWYYSKEEGMLYYIPRNNEILENVDTIIPNVETLVHISGDSSQSVKNIIFSNITFSHTGWLEPNEDTGYIPIQTGYYYKLISGYNVPKKVPSAIHIEHAQGVEILDSNFFYLGGSAIAVDNLSDGNRIARNTVTGISGTGIYIGDDQPALLTTGNQVINNTISYTGSEFFDSVGISIGYAKNTLIEHNEVSHLPYTGISIGGLDDGTSQTGAGSNIIRANHIYDVMTFLCDGGGIYTRSRQDGTVIERNYVHHVYGGSGPPLHSWNHGIYLDNASSYFTVKDNVFHDISIDNVWQQFDTEPFASNNTLFNNDSQNEEIKNSAGLAN